jgi:pyruvate dehydrogenase E2 component (dihydrolipoamide acetyltransferase)
MATKVIMPKQGLQMTEGTITRWIVKEGQQAMADKPLFEMETDKLTIEIMSPVSGLVLKIFHPEGDVVPITETIAVIGQPSEDIASLLFEEGNEKTRTTSAQSSEQPAAASGGRVFMTPRARLCATENDVMAERIIGSGPEGLIIERDILNAVKISGTIPKATPVARKIAQQNAIDLTTVSGMGTGGKIMKADVAAMVAQGSGENSAANKTVSAVGSVVADAAGVTNTARNDRRETLVPLSMMRKVIAERMALSLHTMAQANHRMKVDMTEIIRFREKLKEADIKVSFTDIFVKCVAKALMEFPIVNASLVDGGILMKGYVHMGLAVAVPNGLIVPVIKNADLMTLSEIATASTLLIEKAKKGELAPDDYSGGTFTITNLGMFDIDEFTAIVNPPESAILAIGKIDRVPVVEADQVVIRSVMMLSLSYDHRTIDGAPAAQFLQRVKQILQNPYLLI